MSGLDASAQRSGGDGEGGSKQAAQEDPGQNDLSAPFFRMRFGRDLRLAEVRSAPLAPLCGSVGAEAHHISFEACTLPP